MNMETEQDWTMSFMQATQHIPALTQTQAGFLADWFVVFWDLYINRLQHRRPPPPPPAAVSHQPTANQQAGSGQDKRQLIQRFMSVIGLGNRDPATLSDEERQYLMSMVQRYSSQPLSVSSPHVNGNNNPAVKRHRTDGAPTGVSMPGHHGGPIGTFTPQFPPPPPPPAHQSTLSPPLHQNQNMFPTTNYNPPSVQSLPSDPAAMDRMMANMLSSVIGGTLDPMALPMSPNNPPQPQQKVPQKRPVSQPATTKVTPPIPPSPNTSRPASTTEQPSLYSPDFGNVMMMITPLSLTPPPQPFLMDDMESIMLSSGGSTKSDKQEFGLQLIRSLYSTGQGVKVTAVAEWKQYLFVGRKDGRLAMIRIDNGQEVMSCQPHSMAVSKIVGFNDFLVSSGHDRLIVGHQLRNGKLVEFFRLPPHQSSIQSIVGLNTDRLASCDAEGRVTLWKYVNNNLQMVQSIDTKQVGPNTNYQLARSEDSKHIAVAIADEVWIVNTDDLKVEHKIQVKVPVSSVFYAHGFLVLTGASLCFLYDPKDGYTLRHTSPSLPDKVFSCSLLSLDNNNLLAVLGSYQRAFLWTVGSATVSHRHIHDGIVACVEPYRDCGGEGGMVFTAGHDGVVKLWRVAVEDIEKSAVASNEQDDLDLVLRSFTQ